MKISIIIPTYQPGDYFYECLDSLKNQCFSSKDFEVVIVLNGTRYPYEDKIVNYVNTEMANVSVNYIYSDIPGVSNARNIGIENAVGEYILFFDDDDLVSEDYLKALYDCRVENGIVVSNVKTFMQNISDLSDDYLSKAYNSNRKTNPENIFKLRSFLSVCWGKLIPKKLISGSRFDVSIGIGEDSLFMFLLSRRIKTINLCPDYNVLYCRRERPNSASREKKTLFFRIKLSCVLTIKYTVVYIKDMTNYNFLLYISRIVAGILRVFK